MQPQMTEAEVTQFELQLAGLGSLLEFGCGGSTLVAARQVRRIRQRRQRPRLAGQGRGRSDARSRRIHALSCRHRIRRRMGPIRPTKARFATGRAITREIWRGLSGSPDAVLIDEAVSRCLPVAVDHSLQARLRLPVPRFPRPAALSCRAETCRHDSAAPAKSTILSSIDRPRQATAPRDPAEPPCQMCARSASLAVTGPMMKNSVAPAEGRGVIRLRGVPLFGANLGQFHFGWSTASRSSATVIPLRPGDYGRRVVPSAHARRLNATLIRHPGLGPSTDPDRIGVTTSASAKYWAYATRMAE